jgi:hypothetical protein
MNDNDNENVTFDGIGHYVRTDAEGRILSGYASWKGPINEGDTLLHTSIFTLFRLFPDQKDSPPLMKDVYFGDPVSVIVQVYTHKLTSDGPVERSAEEIEADAEALRLAALPGRIREERLSRLRAADENMYEWVPMDPEKRQEWRDYMQALRDITKQPGFPTDITWPTRPE